MKILVLSKECWRNDQNGGNVLSNMFEGVNAEFAQVYCSSGTPSNNICKRYYQITDTEVVRFCLGKLKADKIGKSFVYDTFPSGNALNDNSCGTTKRWISGDFARLAREVVWRIAPWKSERLKHFIEDFNPDIIFAPCYGNFYMLSLTRYVYKILRKPIISYISDDHYTFNQFNLSPLFWINLSLRRRYLRKTVKLYSLMYTMTEEQKVQCEKDFKIPVKVLCKSGLFPKQREKKNINTPIRFIYAGGIYLNRWKTLALLADAIRKINAEEIKCVLDIYTNNKLPISNSQLINDGRNVFLHNSVSLNELKQIYASSDVALHVESFDLKNRMKVRLSFSTKIIDCLESGCAVMAICDPKQSGWLYLKRNDAAICIDSPNLIEQSLRKIINNNNILIEYQHKAFELGRRAHDKNVILSGIRKDFTTISAE